MFQDSVPVGSYTDPFLSSVIPMVAPTWCHRANSVGSMSTDLNSEFTHFNFVIRLSKVQQLALLFSTVFGDSRCSGCPCEPSGMHLY